MKNKKKSVIKKFNKNKYYLVLFLFTVLVTIFISAKIVDYISNKDLIKYDDEIIVIKNKDSEVRSLSLRDIRKLGRQKTEINQNNDITISIKGLSLDKLINKVNIDPNINNIIEFVDNKGNKTNMPLESALEVDRVFLVYKTLGKANIDFDKSLGTFYVVDKQEKDANAWIKNVRIINIK